MREAIQLLDKNGDGLVSFPEFVDWWCNQVPPLRSGPAVFEPPELICGPDCCAQTCRLHRQLATEQGVQVHCP